MRCSDEHCICSLDDDVDMCFPKPCQYTGMTVDTCICMVHDPDGAHFRASRGL